MATAARFKDARLFFSFIHVVQQLIKNNRKKNVLVLATNDIIKIYTEDLLAIHNCKNDFNSFAKSEK